MTVLVNRGAGYTLRGYPINRPSIYDLEAEMKQVTAPTLVVCGNEHDPCIEPSAYARRRVDMPCRLAEGAAGINRVVRP